MNGERAAINTSDGERLASPAHSSWWISPTTAYEMVENLLDALLKPDCDSLTVDVFDLRGDPQTGALA